MDAVKKLVVAFALVAGILGATANAGAMSLVGSEVGGVARTERDCC